MAFYYTIIRTLSYKLKVAFILILVNTFLTINIKY